MSPGVRVRMDDASDLQAGLGPELHRHRRYLVEADSLLTPATNVALDLAATLITEGFDVKISSADRELRGTLGGHYAASAGEKGELLVVTDGLAATTMTRRGFEPVAATPRLTSADHRHLRTVTRRLRAEPGSGVRWSVYGALVHRMQPPPDIEKRCTTTNWARRSSLVSWRATSPADDCWRRSPI